MMTTSPAPVLEVQNLGKEYVQTQAFSSARFTVRAFENINLAVRRGDDACDRWRVGSRKIVTRAVFGIS